MKNSLTRNGEIRMSDVIIRVFSTFLILFVSHCFVYLVKDMGQANHKDNEAVADEMPFIHCPTGVCTQVLEVCGLPR